MIRWLLLLAACGDNLHVASDAATPTPDAALRCAPVHGGTITLRQVALGCDQPNAPAPPACLQGPLTLATAPVGDPRLFVLELQGTIRILEHDVPRADPFLDLQAIVTSGGETGLLGLAFSPSYASDRTFYVFYTAKNADPMYPFLDVLARYRTTDDPDVADPTSGEVLLAIPDPFGNHNGGMIEFGPDGYLYVGTGDGGSAGTPDVYGNAQNPSALLGKMLRLDVSKAAYAVPSDNPFGNEVWMLGMRNPWRWSFDGSDLWIGDVGEATVEELDYLPAAKQRGANLGWPMYEGTNCFKPPCDPTDKTFPVDQHLHSDGWWAITGGQVYRGSCYPDWVGTYFFSDTGYGHMQAANVQPDGSVKVTQLPGDFVGYSTSIHADGDGELYETLFTGDLFQLVATP